jgi:hypothetical protein
MMASLASEGEELKIKHTRFSGLRIDDARDALSMVVESQEKFAKDITTLCNVKISAKEFDLVLDAIAPVPEGSARGATFASNKRDILAQLYKSDSRVAPWTGTAFGVLQADNTYRHHYAIVRGTDGGHAERNAENALLGKTGEADSKILAAIAKVKNMPQLIAA